MDKAWINKDDVYRLLANIESVNNLICRREFINLLQGQSGIVGGYYLIKGGAYSIKEYKNPNRIKKDDQIYGMIALIEKYMERVKKDSKKSLMTLEMEYYEMESERLVRFTTIGFNYADYLRAIQSCTSYTDEEIKINIIPKKCLGNILCCDDKTIYRRRKKGMIRNEMVMINGKTKFEFYNLPLLIQDLKELLQ